MGRWCRAHIEFRRGRTHVAGLFRWSGPVIVAAIALVPGPVWATHEVDHRFVVSGSVRSADGTPQANQKVTVAHPRGKISETVFTDRQGAYSALLHLHDQDAGDDVTVTVGSDVKTIKAAYDPKDHHTPRTATVDFGPSSGQAAEPSSAIWWVGLVGVAVAGGVWYWRRKAPRSKGRSGAKSRGRRSKGHSNG